MKNVIFLDYQKSWEYQVETYQGCQDRTYDFSSWVLNKRTGIIFIHNPTQWLTEKVSLDSIEKPGIEESSSLTWLVIRLQHYHGSTETLVFDCFTYLLRRQKQLKPIFVFKLKPGKCVL